MRHMREVARPLLIYDQIGSNRRRAIALIGLFSLIALPSVLYASGVGVALVVLAKSITMGPNRTPQIVLTGPFGLMDYVVAAVAIAVALLAGVVLLAYAFGSSLILTAVGARPLGDREEPELRRVTENLCLGAGLPVPRLYVLEEVGPNAFAIGNSPDQAAIIVTRGLLKLMDRDELQGVIAHEISHIGNRDTVVSSLLIVLTGLLHFPRNALIGLLGTSESNQRRSEDVVDTSDGASIAFLIGWPAMGLPISKIFDALGREAGRLGSQLPIAIPLAVPIGSLVYVVFIAPWLADLARAALSREHESRADADAALLTRNPQGLAEALAKISGATGAQALAVSAVARLCIVDLGGDVRTHPPIERRIAALSAMAGSIRPADLEAAQAEGAAWASAVPYSEVAGRGSFRLAALSTLYDGPSYGAVQVGELREGAVIVVLERHDEFFRVITASDRFGYIPVRTPLEHVADPLGIPTISPNW
jgi:heat shock protein HtpX